jgi:hypothetical protein
MEREFLRNVSKYLPDYTASQKRLIFIVIIMGISNLTWINASKNKIHVKFGEL